jgi:error-prone DNA polymerase
MFIHLHVHSPYSFLDGGSDIPALVREAARYGAPALALTDHNSLCAAVKFTSACEAYGIRPILGAEITLKRGTFYSSGSSRRSAHEEAADDEEHLTLLARNRSGYAVLCTIITEAYRDGDRLAPRLSWEKLRALANPDLICLSGCRKGRIASLVRRRCEEEASEVVRMLQELFGRDNFYIELQDDLTPDSARICADLARLADSTGAGVAATNNVHHAIREDFVAHDVLRCIAAGIHMDQPHPFRPLNAERYLKSPEEMAALFAWRPDALANTVRIAEQCENCLPRQEEITPAFAVPEGHTAASYLREMTYRGAKARFGELPPAVVQRIEHELTVIKEMGYADYFLMVWDIVRWARKQGIRCTGRGSAADCCVAYCLFLTDVDVIRRNLPFARFLSPGRTPDIDMDFPSERRDEIFRHIIEKYGEDHVGMVCTFFTFWARSAVRDVGKVLDLPSDAVDFLAKRLHHSVGADKIEAAFEHYAELKPHRQLIDRFRLLFDLCGRIAGFPRHIGTHSSGVVISAVPLHTIAPMQPSARGTAPIWTLDKDDAEEVGAIKFDVLSLRALSAVADAEAQIRDFHPNFRYDRLPLNDRETYRMMQAGAAVGAFQFESAAQLALAVTLEPRNFEDLVASVALIRPGPIRGNVVRRFVACRNGWARADWVHPCLVPVLSKTYGCIVFQEQVNEVVAVMTGCSDIEADRFRKSLKRHAKMDTMDEPRRWFIERSLQRYPELAEDRLEGLFDQIEGWSGYGFIEGHAAAFSLTGYKTAYLSMHHPAEHFASMMNHQPMGFYSSNALAGEARRRGVRILPVDINESCDKCIAEDPQTIRLGFRIVAGMSSEDIEAILDARRDRPFASLLDFCARVVAPRDVIENLILCGAFDRLHDHRRGILWRLEETLDMARVCRAEETEQEPSMPVSPIMGAAPGARRLALGNAALVPTPTAWDISDFSPWDKFVWAWRITGICADCHAMAYMRDYLDRRRVLRTAEVTGKSRGARVRVAGINVRPHRPPTRSGEPVLFAQVEDETGLLPVTVAGEAIDRCTATFLTAPAVLVEGIVEKRGRGTALLVERAAPLALRDATEKSVVSALRWEKAPEVRGVHGPKAAPVLAADAERRPD